MGGVGSCNAGFQEWCEGGSVPGAAGDSARLMPLCGTPAARGR